MSRASTYPLRLPISIRAGVERASKRDGISINQFVSIAVAEKLAHLDLDLNPKKKGAGFHERTRRLFN